MANTTDTITIGLGGGGGGGKPLVSTLGNQYSPPIVDSSSYAITTYTDMILSGNLVIGGNADTVTDIYICEEWQSKKPIKIKEGMFVSFKDDLYTHSEIEEIVFDKIEEDYPELSIKLGLGKDKIRVKKYTIPTEINQE